VIPFDCATYRTATKWSPGGHALRFHIGLEDLDDLKRDLDAGFARLKEADARAA
jgi:cystathionine beta-lyase